MPLRCELHSHSWHSSDCHVSPTQIARICERQEIDVIALTDHNSISGADELQKIAPSLRVIRGEEVSTKQGEIIGLFLQDLVEPWQDIGESIRQIKAQGGLVLIPHPFDRIRPGAVGGPVLEQIVKDIDFIEIFNARCLLSSDNSKAANFIRKYQLHPFVGSDAHTPGEYGQALNLIEDFKTAQEFKENLQTAEFLTKRSGVWVHLRSQFTKFDRRMRPRNYQ